MSELKQTIEQIQKSFEDFQKSNDERIAQIEKRGHADPLLVEQVDKANAEITALTEKMHAEQERADEIEARMNRAEISGSSEQAAIDAKNAKLFSEQRSIELNKPVSLDVEEYTAYKDALLAYARHDSAALTPEQQRAMSVGSDPNGGYWVTPDMSGRIARLVYETSPMRQVASVQTISTDALEGVNDLDEASIGGWVGETGTRSETGTPEIGEWRIPVHEHYAEPRATQKLLDDASVDVEAWLNGKVANKLARTEAAAFITGDGSKKPRGILTYTAGTPTASSWEVIEQKNSGASGDFAASDPGDALIDLVYLLKGVYREGASWMMNRSTLGEVRKLKDGNGNYLWQPDFTQQRGGTLVGYGIAEAEDMPDIAADSLSIAFGNFAEGYQIVDRQGIRILRDPYTAKPYIKFYTTKRVGGGVVNFEAIKIMKFAA